MHSFPANIPAILMAIVMAASPSVCRCGTSACDAPHSSAIVRPAPAPSPCAHRCSKDQAQSPDAESPLRCADCQETDTAFERPTPAAHLNFDLHALAARALDPTVFPRASSGATRLPSSPLDPPIAILLQSCHLLI